MKLLTCLLSSLVLLTFPARAAEPVSPSRVFTKLAAGQKQTVVVYGTSLTVGGAWAVETRKWFEAAYPGLVTFVNGGGSGQNSTWGVTSLPSKVLAATPDLVFIEFSFNDAHVKFALSVEKAADNLAKIVHGIQQASPETTIVLQTMNLPWDAKADNPSAGNRPQLEAFNDNYRKYARDHGLTLLDHYPVWQKFAAAEPERYHKLVPDGTHPNAEGSLLVTWPTIKAWLEKERAAATKPPK